MITKHKSLENKVYLWYVFSFLNLTSGEDQANANTTVHLPCGSTQVEAETAAQIASPTEEGMLRPALKLSRSKQPPFQKSDGKTFRVQSNILAGFCIFQTNKSVRRKFLFSALASSNSRPNKKRRYILG